YRYHHLFAGLLRQRLWQQDPALVAELHRRASHWFEENAFLSEAFDHAIAAEDFTRAGAIVATHSSVLYRRGEGMLVAEWFTQLPQPIIFADPTLCLARAWISYFGQRPQEIEQYLTQIEEQYRDGMERHVQKRLRSSVAGLRGWAAYATGRLDRALTLCHEALALADAEQNSWRGLVTLFLASALREQGATVQAANVAENGIQLSRSAGNLSAGLGAVYHLAECYRLLGQLHKAQVSVDAALTYAAQHAAERAQDVGYVLVAQAELHYERNELHECGQALARCAEITRWRSTKSTVPAAICQARLQLAQGNPHEAHTALIRAQQELRSWEAEQEVTHIAAHIAMLQLAMQETAAVTYWQQKTRLDTQSPATYANELVLMTVARLLIAQGVDEGQPAFTAALGLLE
ncbi:MAG: hypothetical protein KDE31_33000, partial [Caldilineaceae bacterium]|nr:hypothetical protein [Caldilineaceae bacterium]